MRRHRVLTTAIVAGALALGGAAPAWGAATAVDGPSADIANGQAVQIDAAPDGTAAVAYLKTDAGKQHVFVSTRAGTAWSAPQRVDIGLLLDSKRVAVAVANGGKVVVTFVNTANPTYGNLYSAIKPSAGTAFQAPGVLNGNDSAYYARPALAPNGNGYAAISTFGNGAYDVRASKLVGTTWTPVGDTYPNAVGKLDNDETKNAGPDDSQRELRLAVNGDGSAATLIWSEGDGAAVNDTFVRRLTGTAAGNIGPALKASLDPGTMVGGFPATTDSQVPDVDVYADNAWVVFRQSIAYGGPINDTLGATLNGGAWAPATPFNATPNGTIPSTAPVITDTGSGAIAWLFDPGGGAKFQVRARSRVGVGGFAPEVTLSRADLGDVVGAGLEIVADAAGNGYAAFVQGSATPAQPRSVVVADVPLPGPVVNPKPPGSAFDTTDPVTTRASVSPRTFRLGSALPGLVKATVKTSAIRFTLSEAARVRMGFERAVTGRRVGRRCLASTRARRRRAKCTRYVALRTKLSFNAPKGANRLRFQGRLTRRVTLTPAFYRVTITATDAAGNLSREVRTTFKLLPKLKPKPKPKPRRN